ncbi:MAG TPA: hypothetical protein VNM48_00530, partial [Chloroflexota bacterium]|nr:hypothetical protein [Chloroflexota bacterium]
MALTSEQRRQDVGPSAACPTAALTREACAAQPLPEACSADLAVPVGGEEVAAGAVGAEVVLDGPKRL